jgi:hypothetical protein
MGENKQDSYRIGKILKKLTGLKFIKSRQASDLSSNGKEKAETYYSTRQAIRTLRPTDHRKKEEKKEPDNRYLQHQKEVQAQRLMGKKEDSKAPGEILKLPVDRKELMLK